METITTNSLPVRFFRWAIVDPLRQFSMLLLSLSFFMLILFALYLLEITGVLTFIFGIESTGLQFLWEDVIWYGITGRWY
ncbi:hypothetical protein H5203_22170 [Pseudoalteromonas sp. SG41-1]|uniref:hypothetical protein n=1 Tax=Pseudoalteromonas sp. SG41-1 TaxID=2760979 RepID=UPI001603C1A9|nr:hypothetical protein [Pseudoalteromonas sp. SG41-1]MBB1508144.1 hypothetical protein [Pseudoalteromonas sp. SG41-1]